MLYYVLYDYKDIIFWKSYISNRLQFASLCNTQSQREIICGVPQESFLRPTLFKYMLFADDTFYSHIKLMTLKILLIWN